MRLKSLLIFLIFAAACNSGNVPKDVLPPEKMVPIVYDLIKADEWVNGYLLNDTTEKPNTIFVRTYEQVFAIHKVEKANFYNSFRFYQQHPNINKVLFDSIHSLANRQQNLLYQKKFAPKTK